MRNILKNFCYAASNAEQAKWRGALTCVKEILAAKRQIYEDRLAMIEIDKKVLELKEKRYLNAYK